MPVTAKQLLEAANAAVPKISGKEAQDMVANGALLVDIRDSSELAATGKAAGSLHIPRGSLEFKADPSLEAYHDRRFDPDKRLVVYCASGGRSALSAKLLKDMGYPKVTNMLGGFTAWAQAGTAALSDITNAVQRIRELVVQAANGTQTQSDMSADASEVNQLIDQIKQDANTQYNGQYIFSGAATSTAPYQAGSNDAYAGDNGRVTRVIGPNTSLPKARPPAITA